MMEQSYCIICKSSLNINQVKHESLLHTNDLLTEKIVRLKTTLAKKEHIKAKVKTTLLIKHVAKKCDHAVVEIHSNKSNNNNNNNNNNSK